MFTAGERGTPVVARPGRSPGCERVAHAGGPVSESGGFGSPYRSYGTTVTAGVGAVTDRISGVSKAISMRDCVHRSHMVDTPQGPIGVLRRFRQPEYTGENRCRPCTVLNTGIAVVLGAAVALVSIPVGIVVFVASVAAIAVRGYLVPGTPTLVQYLPDRVHDAIGPGHDTGSDDEMSFDDSFDVEETLTSTGIIRECEDVDDLCLTESYRRAFHEQLDELAEASVQRERLAESLSVPAEDITFDESAGRLDVFVEDVRAGGWRSRAAFLADLANQRLLESRLGGRWEALSSGHRTQLLVALRTFVETCPVCGGDVVPDEDVVRTCCRDDVVSVTTTCVDCDATVFKGTE